MKNKVAANRLYVEVSEAHGVGLLHLAPRIHLEAALLSPDPPLPDVLPRPRCFPVTPPCWAAQNSHCMWLLHRTTQGKPPLQSRKETAKHLTCCASHPDMSAVSELVRRDPRHFSVK